jgi:hypothetical protein
VVNFSGKITTNVMCLFGKTNVDWLWHRRLVHFNMKTLQNPQEKPLYQISQIYLKLGSLFVDAGTEG